MNEYILYIKFTFDKLDGGNPLTYETESGQHILIGVGGDSPYTSCYNPQSGSVNDVRMCSLFTRVSEYRSWIENIIFNSRSSSVCSSGINSD